MKSKWDSRDVCILDYINGINTGRYKIDPNWQRLSFRNEEWKSGIINHLWEWNDLNPLYFHKTEKNGHFVLECLDGRQRSEAIKDFVENKFRLCGKQSGLPIYLCNKMFSEWPQVEQARFKEFNLKLQIMESELSSDEIARFFQDRQHSSDTKTGEQIGANPAKLCYKWLDEAISQKNSVMGPVIEKLWGKNDRKTHLMVVAACLYIHIQTTDLRDPTPEVLLELWNSDGVKRSEFDDVMKLMHSTYIFMAKSKIQRQSDKSVFCAFFKLFSSGISSEALVKLSQSEDPKLCDLVFANYGDSPYCCRHKTKSIYNRFKFLKNLAGEP
jgi:hypothetical protein